MCLLLQNKLRGFDLWRTSFSVLKGSLISAAQLLRAWSSEASTLCSDWAMGLEAEGHLWQGGGYADTHLAAFQDRIEQVSGCVFACSVYRVRVCGCLAHGR